MALFAPSMLRLLAWSWRVERIGSDHLEEAESGALVAMWHGRMLPPLPLHRHRGIGILVSPSDDGGLVKLMLDRFGYRTIRGSSSRQGARALREMRDQIREGEMIVITPDGPRGPRHGMNVGLAWLASETGTPIMTVAVGCDRAWRLKSWDRFLIPKPWARVVISYGELLRVPPDADDGQLERVTEQIRENLMVAEARAFASLGVDRDW